MPQSQVEGITSSHPNTKSQIISNDFFSDILDSDEDEKVPSDFNSTAKQTLDILSLPEVSYINQWMRWLHYEER